MADFASVTQKAVGPRPQQQQQQSLKLYKTRWMILAVYMVYSMANAVHWIQYSIISNITGKFYGVSNFAIDTTSTIYMIVYVPLVVPASWVLDRLVSATDDIGSAWSGAHRIYRRAGWVSVTSDDTNPDFPGPKRSIQISDPKTINY